MDLTHFDITQAEREAGSLAPSKLAQLRDSFETNGYAVVSGLISAETCDLLLQSVLEDVAHIRTRPEPTLHEQRTGIGHLQLGLRRYAPYVKSDLVANPLIESIIIELLGAGAWLGFYNGNVNCPGSGFQPLHLDRPFAWKSAEEAAAAGQPWPPPTITVSCSVALFDITEANATEIYPGTHRETAVIEWPRGDRPEYHPDLIEKWGPSGSMTIPAGGICFRDPRMWHRGVANQSDRVRPMIGLTYHSGLAKHWKGLLTPDMTEDQALRCAADPTLRMMNDGTLGDGRLVFDSSVQDVFDSAENPHNIDRNVRFADAAQTVNHFVDAHLLGGARVVPKGQITPYPD